LNQSKTILLSRRPVDSNSRLMSIAYWSYRDWLILASPGSIAILKYIDLHENQIPIKSRFV